MKPAHQEKLLAYEQLRKDHRLLPVKITSFYRQKIEEESQAFEAKGLCPSEGPLYRIAYPSSEKISEKSPLEVDDFVDDRSNMPQESQQDFIHKYPKTVLFLPSSQCLAHCMYCFRQDVLEEKHHNSSPASDMSSLEYKVSRLINYIQQHPELHEVILSGGDPLILPAKQLHYIFDRIQKNTKIQHFRIHTRSLVFQPKSFTPAHIDVLASYRVRCVFHIVHPYEICEDVVQSIHKLRQAGLRLYNHFPILRKINDHPEVLSRLVEQLDELHIQNLSIYFPDPVQYSSAFRIHFARLFQIAKTFNHTTPSWINATRFCQDSPQGKVRMDDLVEYDPSAGYATFLREGRHIRVPDHPKDMDRAGKLENMLWKTVLHD